MRVIARSTLNALIRKRVPSSLQDVVQENLDAWHDRVLEASWRNSAELKADFGTASIISSDRVVFNIKGNDFRLVAVVDYNRKGVMILWLGTHGEYDEIDVREVWYDRRRYFDSSDSQ